MLRFFLVSIIGLYAVQDVNRLSEIYSEYDLRACALEHAQSIAEGTTYKNTARSLNRVTRTWREAVCEFCNEQDQADCSVYKNAAREYVFRAWENEISASRLELNALNRVQGDITNVIQYPQSEELGSAILDLNSIERRWKDRIESMERILNIRSYPGICVEARREKRHALINPDFVKLSETKQAISVIQRVFHPSRK